MAAAGSDIDVAGAAASASPAIAVERLSACMLCGSADVRPWRTGARDYQQADREQRYEYAACRSCGVCFESVRPLETELQKIYFAGYGPYQDAPPAPAAARPLHPALRPAVLAARALAAALEAAAPSRLGSTMDQFYDPPGAGQMLLDYGCGAPTFLDQARARGWDTLGSDFSTEVLDAVSARGHRTAAAGHELDHEVADGSITAIRMNHVIEHLYRPREVLSQLRRKLRDGGGLHLSTPNPMSLGSRLFGRRWLALDAPRHVALYRPPVMRALLTQAGFDHIRIEHEVGAKDLARSWGIALYERGRIPHEQIAAFGEDLRRARLLAPVAKLAALLSLADRYHVFARARP